MLEPNTKSTADSLHILVVAPRFPAINQPWIDTYLEQLLAHRIEPVIYSMSDSSAVYSDKVDRLNLMGKVVRFPLERGALLKAAFLRFWRPWQLIRALRVTRLLASPAKNRLYNIALSLQLISKSASFRGIRLVHSHAESLAYRFLHITLIQNIPLVLTFHGLPPAGIAQLEEPNRRALYRHVARVLVNTCFAKEQVCDLGCDPEKVIIMPQGLPVEDFPFVPRQAPGPGQPLKLLSVGRFHRDKGQGYSLLALRRLLDKGLRVHWTFVGVGPDLVRLRELVSRLNLTDHVSFLEGLPSNQLKALYHSSHLFILSSTNSPGGHVETQGVVLQEAQASGCIPIATSVGGIPECINHKQDALLVPQKCSRALCDAVCHLLEHPSKWEAYQRSGRENVERYYSASVIGSKMAEILRNIATG